MFLGKHGLNVLFLSFLLFSHTRNFVPALRGSFPLSPSKLCAYFLFLTRPLPLAGPGQSREGWGWTRRVRVAGAATVRSLAQVVASEAMPSWHLQTPSLGNRRDARKLLTLKDKLARRYQQAHETTDHGSPPNPPTTHSDVPSTPKCGLEAACIRVA